MTHVNPPDDLKYVPAVNGSDRDAMVAMGIPVCKEGDSGYATVKAIDDYLCKRGVWKYTFDKDLPFNTRLRITTSRVEVWRSHYRQFIEKDFPIYDDCDGLALTAIQLATIMGVPQNRLALGIVVSETAWKHLNRKADMSNVDHAIGMFYHEGKWMTFGDTWGLTQSPSMVPANERHRVVIMSIVDEGWHWRKFTE